MPDDLNLALYFESEAYTLSGNVMGRQAAGAALVRALAGTKQSKLWSYSRERSVAEGLAQSLAEAGSPRTGVAWIPLTQPERLAEPGLLYRPDPMIAHDAWRRLDRSRPSAYSLCGITHTTATHAVMGAFAGLLTAPLEPWDAIICTSRAVRTSVESIVESQASYLRERFGQLSFVLPQLPVIPLGVQCEDKVVGPAARTTARSALGIEPSEVMVLFVGRLSFHGKAHPVAMYIGLEAASRDSKVVLVQAGWFANESIERAFREDAKALCPSIRQIFVDGRDQNALRQAWAAADVFTSLSDNIQETFGLTPLEAMAASIPVVVSDWDGYRDTVRHGIDGFRIPTLTLPAGAGARFADGYDLNLQNYDHYCAYSSQFIAVDTEAATQAYAALISNAELRTNMGKAGRRRAAAEFDWAVILDQYDELWAGLRERRQADQNGTSPLTRRRRPDRPDPFTFFASYPTSTIEPLTSFQTRVGVTISDAVARLDLATTRFAQQLLPSADLIAKVVGATSKGVCTTDELRRRAPDIDAAMLDRALVWLTKVGVLKHESASRADSLPTPPHMT